ncbi:hypothetical protein JCM13210_23970 [Thermaerobacter litoralis]
MEGFGHHLPQPFLGDPLLRGAKGRTPVASAAKVPCRRGGARRFRTVGWRPEGGGRLAQGLHDQAAGQAGQAQGGIQQIHQVLPGGIAQGQALVPQGAGRVPQQAAHIQWTRHGIPARDEPVQAPAQGLGQGDRHRQRRVFDPPLDVAQVGRGDVGPACQFLDGQARRLPGKPDALADGNGIGLHGVMNISTAASGDKAAPVRYRRSCGMRAQAGCGRGGSNPKRDMTPRM